MLNYNNYTNLDDHTQQTTDTSGLKPFTMLEKFIKKALRYF